MTSRPWNSVESKHNERSQRSTDNFCVPVLRLLQWPTPPEVNISAGRSLMNLFLTMDLNILYVGMNFFKNSNTEPDANAQYSEENVLCIPLKSLHSRSGILR